MPPKKILANAGDTRGGGFYRIFLPLTHLNPDKYRVKLVQAFSREDVREADLIFFQRPITAPIIAALDDAKSQGKTVGCDMDDNFELIPWYNPTSKQYAKLGGIDRAILGNTLGTFGPDVVQALNLSISKCDFVIAATPALAQFYSKKNSLIFVCENFIDESHIVKNFQEFSTPVLIYTAANWHLGDVLAWATPVRRLIQEVSDSRLFIYGSENYAKQFLAGHPKLWERSTWIPGNLGDAERWINNRAKEAVPEATHGFWIYDGWTDAPKQAILAVSNEGVTEVPIDSIMWDTDLYTRKLGTLGGTIGLAPYESNSFNLFKGWARLLEYLANGITFVASDMGEYHRFVVESDAGFRACNNSEWLALLKKLANPQSEFYRRAQHKGLKAVQNYTIQKNAYKWEQVFDEALERKSVEAVS